ncbi:glycosyltransferase family 2 protein [Candidatus Woesearchaeota archaeon]|nr:MAG: hypothetical protein QS99_C0007G0044 [archaeon GW2011_AR4]MBS3129452.1 glycosyltransferase family 2 protein [Candidatus Woesearchaeota archaeon]HIH38493.1 glycosyltransferase family 2 protein [Candidatus Woesearchaeota archaeon]HIH49767.1 glycosyltransferase family 2 protein [Candidatus Woesearchaeota archaeon]HIJ03506.1 glycosyltransferase family 2 protein [Candidatus Woesearchaeota archaeon]
MKKPLVSIIVLTWNGKQYLKNCLDSCFSQTYKQLEIIVVDNGSHDGTSAFVQKTYPKTRLITLPQNAGFAEGNNAGIRAAAGEWIFVLNNDTKLKPRCIEALAKAVEGKKNVGMGCPKMYFWEEGIDTLGLRFKKQGYTTDIKELLPHEVPLAPCGGDAFYRKKMLDDISFSRPDGQQDYFDSDYFIYAEDFDLGLRARIAGWECLYADGAELHHLHGATMNHYSDKQVYLGDRNRNFTIIKNYPMPVLIKKLPSFILMQAATLLKWAFKGKPLPIIKSKWETLRALPQLIKKRKNIQKHLKISTKEFEALMR